MRTRRGKKTVAGTARQRINILLSYREHQFSPHLPGVEIAVFVTTLMNGRAPGPPHACLRGASTHRTRRRTPPEWKHHVMLKATRQTCSGDAFRRPRSSLVRSFSPDGSGNQRPGDPFITGFLLPLFILTCNFEGWPQRPLIAGTQESDLPGPKRIPGNISAWTTGLISQNYAAKQLIAGVVTRCLRDLPDPYRHWRTFGCSIVTDASTAPSARWCATAWVGAR